jgi:hypothetical protein
MRERAAGQVIPALIMAADCAADGDAIAFAPSLPARRCRRRRGRSQQGAWMAGPGLFSGGNQQLTGEQAAGRCGGGPGARSPSNKAGMAPCRSTSMSSLEPAPAAIPATRHPISLQSPPRTRR